MANTDLTSYRVFILHRVHRATTQRWHQDMASWAMRDAYDWLTANGYLKRDFSRDPILTEKGEAARLTNPLPERPRASLVRC